MQNDIVRQQPKTEEAAPLSVVQQDIGNEEVPAPPLVDIEDNVAPQPLEAPAIRRTKPVGIIVTALVICASLCAAVIYGNLRNLA